MTTILVKDNKMYGDGQCTGQHISSYTTKKIANFGSAIVGGAGRWASVVKFHQWVYEILTAQAAQEDHPFANVMMPEDMVEDDFIGVVLYPDGVVIMFEGCKNPYEHEQPLAIGSGADFAIACAHNGLDGETCIKTAIHFDTGSGGEIQVEGFEEEEPIVSVEDMQDWSKEEILAYLKGEVGKVVEEVEGEIREEETIHFKDGVFELTIYSDGAIHDHVDGRPCFLSFEEVQSRFDLCTLKGYADLLNVDYPHNIGKGTLTKKLDKKVQEIVDEMNK